MYWYISFLRPPPVSISSTTKEVIITPQVANDLRTELRYEPTPIQYIWQRLSPPVSPPTAPEGLTIFIPPQSTYKPISIPLPSNIQIGESWRLGLFSSPTTSSEGKAGGPSSSLLGLCEDNVDVIGVWSEGINIIRPELISNGTIRGVNGKSINSKAKEKEKEAKGKGKGKEREKDDGPKQGRITRDFTLPRRNSEGEEEELLRIIEQTSFDLDKKIWDSGLALSSWFWKYLPSPGDDSHSHPHILGKEVIDLIRRKDDSNILELGSGTGLVSIALSLAFQRYFPGLRRNISTTDLESAIPLMNENLAFNSSSRPSSVTNEEVQNTSVDARVLDWDEPLPQWVSERYPELIIAADVTYNTSAFPSLLRTLTSLLNPDPNPKGIKPILVLAYKQRDLAERELWKMLSEKDIEMILIDKIPGVEKDYGETEIWVGRMK